MQIDNVWLVHPERAQKTKLGDRTVDIGKVNHIWVGVRGVTYHQHALRRARGAPFGKLVPQRNNPYDSTAIAINAEGAVIGYVPRAMAYVLYSQIGHLSHQGHPRQVPIRIQTNPDNGNLSAWVCVPTRKGIDKLVPIKILHSNFLPLWDALPSALRETIAKDAFHLSDETGAALWGYTNHAPEFWLSGQFDAQNVDIGVTLALKRMRELRNRKVEQKRKRRNKNIVIDNHAGLTNAEIAVKHDVSKAVVYSVLKEAGLSAVRPKTAATGLTESHRKSIVGRAQRCIHAADLQVGGASRSEIASEMGTSVKTIEKYLPDGKFYREMSLNPGRKLAALSITKDLPIGDISDDELRQARIDAVVILTLNLSTGPNLE